jgi:hypothetical protein
LPLKIAAILRRAGCGKEALSELDMRRVTLLAAIPDWRIGSPMKPLSAPCLMDCI